MSSEVIVSETREGYKRVQLGPRAITLPEQWEINPVKELFEIKKESFDPSELDGKSEVMLYSMPAYDSGREPIQTPVSEVGSKKYRVPEDTVLFPKLNIRKRRFWRVRHNHCLPAVCSTEYWPLLPKKSIELDFYHYYFDSYEFTSNPKVSSASSTNSHKRVKQSSFEKLRLPVPPLAEQRRIADIISVVDDQIRQTEKIIEKTEELRIGLMNEFFHTGYHQHSTTTKGTLGEVPTDWDVHPLSDVSTVEMGSSPKSEYYNKDGDGLPFFQANNEFGYRLPTHDRWCSEPNKIAAKSDTLITIRGTYVGQVNVAPERCCIGRGLAAISATDVDQEYLYHQLAHREQYVKSIASGSTFDSINSTELRSLSVQVPPRDEQEKIASCLRNIQHKYTKETEYKKRLQELKRGLMQDLLTGKVRVNTD